MNHDPQVIATGVAGTGGSLAWFVSVAEPIMKLVTFGLTTTVAVLTIAYTWKRLRGKAKD